MKAHTIEWMYANHVVSKEPLNPAGKINRIMQLSARSFLALVPALAIVVGAAWLVTAPDLAIYLQATLWASGLIFLGLAIDTESPFNVLSLLTGLALPALALISSQVAVEVAIVAATLVAVWLAAAIWRR